MESQLRQAVPSDERIHVGHTAAIDLVPYQLDPARQALRQPRQRILIADAGSPNLLLRLQTLQRYAELLYLIEHEKHHAGDTIAVKRRKAVMDELAVITASATYTD